MNTINMTFGTFSPSGTHLECHIEPEARVALTFVSRQRLRGGGIVLSGGSGGSS
jgi:hypothetical protein